MGFWICFHFVEFLSWYAKRERKKRNDIPSNRIANLPRFYPEVNTLFFSMLSFSCCLRWIRLFAFSLYAMKSFDLVFVCAFSSFFCCYAFKLHANNFQQAPQTSRENWNVKLLESAIGVYRREMGPITWIANRTIAGMLANMKTLYEYND